MASGKKNTANLNADTRKVIFYEGPHKVYVGNLPWSTQPADLRQHFSQFGTVVSIKLFRDRKSGKRRVYGFLSFSNIEELQAAVLSSGTVPHSFLGSTPTHSELYLFINNARVMMIKWCISLLLLLMQEFFGRPLLVREVNARNQQ